jgi:hypothetical protein
MLHKDYDSKGSVETKISCREFGGSLAPRRNDWRETATCEVTLALTLILRKHRMLHDNGKTKQADIDLY